MRRRASVFATVRPARSSRRPRLRNPLQVNLNTVTCMTMPCCIRLSLSLSLLSLSLSLDLAGAHVCMVRRVLRCTRMFSVPLAGRITIIRCPIRSGSAAGHCPAPPTAPHRRHTHSPHSPHSPPKVRFRVRAGAGGPAARAWGRTARKIEAEPVRERVFGDGKTGRGVRACNVPFGYRANLVFPKVFPVFR